MIGTRIAESPLLRLVAAAALTPDSPPPTEQELAVLYDPACRSAAMQGLAWAMSGRLWLMRRALQQLSPQVLWDVAAAAEVLRGHAAQLAVGEDTQVMLPVDVDGYPVGGGTR